MKEILQQLSPIPLKCSWELTLACNMRCQHCGSSAGSMRPKELDTREALDVCDALLGLGCEDVTLLGGEPLVRPDWPQIVQRFASAGAFVTLISNGKSISSATAQQIAASGTSCVGLSLDGMEGHHNTQRCDDIAFSSVRNAVEALHSADIPTSIVTVVSERNIEDLDAMAETMSAWGISQWQLQLTIPKGRATDTIPMPDLTRHLIDKIIDLKSQYPILLYPGCNVGYFYRETNVRLPIANKIDCWTGCYAGLLHVAIRSNGDVTGCLTMPDEWTAGNVRESSLKEIWLNDKAFINRRNICGTEADQCAYGSICRGGCRTLGYYGLGREQSCGLCALAR